ncbi:16S rRNA (adenine(1518)-N(6)/adenine(1519)-N(6))-dimethyltransferase RsmA, partial [Omnitrophica bacterium]|nr:16S rRNA (adenine(1518)-N(6)/adenine(1519)-N(6))-dimethyltransferase RsmA [Candidatus Omnitrophota bacterium]
MLTKTQIKELAKEHDFYLKKRLGQNLLIDKNLRDKIIRLIDLGSDDTVLEIGAGLGALTEALADGCRFVYAVEKDKKLYELAKELLSGHKNLEVIYCDFLRFDIGDKSSEDLKVVGALPFCITSPIIQHLLNFRERISAIFIIVQKEVARRLAAKAGEDDYSALSLFVQFSSQVELLMDIRKDVFFPAPKVDAKLVKLTILRQPPVKVRDEKALFKVIRQAFAQRRKTLLASLSHKGILGLDREAIGHILGDLG